MGGEPAQLLRHVVAVGEDRDLLRQPLCIDRDTRGQLLHGRGEPVPLLDQTSGRARGKPVQRPLDDHQSIKQILRKPRPLRLAHTHQGMHRIRHQRQDGDGIDVGQSTVILKRAGDHLGQTEQRGEVDLHGETSRFRNGTQLLRVGQEPLHIDARPFIHLALDAQGQRDVPARHVAPQQFTDVGLHPCQRRRQLDRRREEPMVDAANLHRQSM